MKFNGFLKLQLSASTHCIRSSAIHFSRTEVQPWLGYTLKAQKTLHTQLLKWLLILEEKLWFLNATDSEGVEYFRGEWNTNRETTQHPLALLEEDLFWANTFTAPYSPISPFCTPHNSQRLIWKRSCLFVSFSSSSPFPIKVLSALLLTWCRSASEILLNLSSSNSTKAVLRALKDIIKNFISMPFKAPGNTYCITCHHRKQHFS